MNHLLDGVKDLAHSPIHNYVIPGLTSRLVGGVGTKKTGCVRLFSNRRVQTEMITPHSHRFDFTCLVIKGWVDNSIWVRGLTGDPFESTGIYYGGEPGAYTQSIGGIDSWYPITTRFNEGETYSMTHDEVHSIQFSKGAEVLFFEGPEVYHTTMILQPVVDEVVLNTFRVEPWMFKKG